MTEPVAAPTPETDEAQLLDGEVAAPPPPTPRGARAQQAVDAARALLDRAGMEALTMRALAERLGIQAPSLYKHFRNKAAVELALVSDALWDIGHASHAALHQHDEGAAGGPGRLRALASAYRTHAQAAPNLYRLATQGTLDRAALQPGLEEWAGNPWYVATGDEHRAQAAWSFAHGMVVLELDARYPPGSDLDATWAAGITAFAPD